MVFLQLVHWLTIYLKNVVFEISKEVEIQFKNSKKNNVYDSIKFMTKHQRSLIKIDNINNLIYVTLKVVNTNYLMKNLQ